jgi:hypothetical protein
MITFKYNVPLKDTMVFEKLFEKELRLDLGEKSLLTKDNYTTWMYVNGKLAGEIYSLPVKQLLAIEKESLEDIDDIRYLHNDTAYIYTCGVLDKFQGMGYGSLMYAHHLGRLAEGFDMAVGHATDCTMVDLVKKFGACMMQDCVHKNWFGTSRVAKFYEHILSTSNQFQQIDDYSCGVYAMKYWLHLHHFEMDADVIRLMCKPTKKYGTNYKNMVSTLKTICGFVRSGHIEKISQDMLPMLISQKDFNSSDVLHYTVLTDININKATVYDPWSGEHITIGIDKFNELWSKDNNWGLYASK